MNYPQIAAAELLENQADRLFLYCWSVLRSRETAQIALRDTLLALLNEVTGPADASDTRLYSLARAECGRHRAVPAHRLRRAGLLTAPGPRPVPSGPRRAAGLPHRPASQRPRPARALRSPCRRGLRGHRAPGCGCGPAASGRPSAGRARAAAAL